MMQIAALSSRLLALAALAALAAFAQPAMAQSMRCGGKIIDLGMTSAEVAELCGQPDSKKVETQDVRSGNRVVGTTEVSQWTYRQGAVTRVLEFDQGKLVNITIAP